MAGEQPSVVRTFLIADVRGYTAFTQQLGDEAAARLAGRFAEIIRDVIGAHAGELLELRGDEALCVFESPRGALRAAVDLQQRFAEEMRADPSLPLQVGIGIDAGEAVRVERGYRGGALNLAARMCSRAGPGEVLMSEGFVHLAGRVEGVEYEDRGRTQFKGMAQPVRMLQARFDLELPEAIAPEELGARRRRRRRRIATVTSVAILLTATAVAIVLTRRNEETARSALRIRPNTVVRIDPQTERVIAVIPVGRRPGALVAVGKEIWILNEDEETVSIVDPTTNKVKEKFGGGPFRFSMDYGFGSVWVTGEDRTLYRINPSTHLPTARIQLPSDADLLAIGEESIWTLNVDESVSEIDPGTDKVVQTIQLPRPVPGRNGIGVGQGAVWVSNYNDGTVLKVDPSTADVTPIDVGANPAYIAIGFQSLWVANPSNGTVARIAPATGEVHLIRVGSNSGLLYSDVSIGPDSVWAGVPRGPGIARINPITEKVEMIHLPYVPAEILATRRDVWVTIAPSV
jgi:class 3 adenylate cyclase/DNA-binding beta-propeller fold protein YncE